MKIAILGTENSDNYVELKLPPSLTDSELIIDEGIEIFLAFKEVQQTCKNKPGYENFVKNFETLEDKVKNSYLWSRNVF